MSRAALLLILALLGWSRPARADWDLGGGWRTARSPHFVVHGQTTARTLELAAARFEETRVALGSTFFPSTVVPLVEAVILPALDYNEMLGSTTSGVFVSGVGLNGSLLVIRESQSLQFAETVLAHELAHRFVHARYPRLPSWMNEGVASFLETVAVREQALRFGDAPTTAIHFELGGGVSFAELMSAQPADLYGPNASAYYTTAWALTHHLLTGGSGFRLDRFQQLLEQLNAAGGDSNRVRAAFQDVYPERTLDEWEQTARSRAARTSALGVVRVVDVPFSPPEAPAVTIDRADAGRIRTMVRQVSLRYQAHRAQVEAENDVDVTLDRHYLRIEVVPGLPPSYWGMAGGRRVTEHGAVELALGFDTAAKYRITARYRLHAPISDQTFVTFALGPALAMRSRLLGNDIPHEGMVPVDRTDFFFLLAANPEVALDLHAPNGTLLHVGLGGYFRLAENYSTPCQGEPGSLIARECEDQLDDKGKSIWKRPARAYLGLSLGGHF
jgi:hypothetical protein